MALFPIVVVQVDPFEEYMIVFDASLPTATKNVPVQVTPLPLVAKSVTPNPAHVVPPVVLYKIVFVPCPTATQVLILLNTTALPAVVKSVAASPVQVIPLVLCAIVLVPLPTATYLPFP